MSNRHLFDVLPQEILVLVLNERRLISFEGFPDLRLVCKAINEIIEPWVFSTCTVQYKKQYPETVVWRLPSLASGTGPYSRWAKKLQMCNLVPNVNLHYGPSYEEGRRRMLLHQSQWLIPAIRALVNIEEAAYHGNMFEPFKDVIRALADMPKLRSLNLSFSGVSEQDHLLLERFSDLTTLKLGYHGYQDPSFVESMRQLIKNCPRIVELEIGQRYDPPRKTPFDFIVLVKDLIDSPTFTPTLKKLAFAQDRVILTPSCVPFLRSLTHLHILQDSKRVDPVFWAALQDSGIQLQGLYISPMCQSIIDYLQSYAGLQEILLGLSDDKSAPPVDDHQLCYQFFHTVLLRHKSSLQSINLRKKTVGPWCITEAHLKQVYLCQGLKYLAVILYYPTATERRLLPVMSLEALLSSIARNLPNLQHLELKMTHQYRLSQSQMQHYEEYINDIERQYGHAISNTTFMSADREPRFFIGAGGFTFRPVSVSGVLNHYRFVKTQRGDPDPDALWESRWK